MNCDMFRSLLPAYPDNMQDPELRAAFLAHAADCQECGKLLSEHEWMLTSLGAMDDSLTLPEGLSQGWRAAIRAGHTQKAADKPRAARWHSFAIAAAAVVFVVTGTVLMRQGTLFPSMGMVSGMQAATEAPTADNTLAAQLEEPSAAKRAMDAFMYDEAPPMASAPEDADAALDNNAAPEAEREDTAPEALNAAESPAAGAASEAPHAPYSTDASIDYGALAQGQVDNVVLQGGHVSLQTEEYDADIEKITRIEIKYDGWTESWSVSGESVQESPMEGRYCVITFRVPREHLFDFIDELTQVGKTTNSGMNSVDTTSLQTRLSLYEEQLAQLQALREAASDISDILKIEERMIEIQYQIDMLRADLQIPASPSSNTTVIVRVQEVPPGSVTPRQLSFWETVRESFSGAFKTAGAFLSDMLVFLVMAFPYLLAALALLLLILLILRAKRKRRAKKEKKENANE